jgi:hypothetical protein
MIQLFLDSYFEWRSANDEYFYTNQSSIRGPESQRQVAANRCDDIIQELRSGQVSMFKALGMLVHVFLFIIIDNCNIELDVSTSIVSPFATILYFFSLIGFFFFISFIMIFLIVFSRFLLCAFTMQSSLFETLKRKRVIFFFFEFFYYNFILLLAYF